MLLEPSVDALYS